MTRVKMGTVVAFTPGEDLGCLASTGSFQSMTASGYREMLPKFHPPSMLDVISTKYFRDLADGTGTRDLISVIRIYACKRGM